RDRVAGFRLMQILPGVGPSTDFEEIAHICHRALVFSRGKIVSELTGSALTTEAVITAASASEAA
ncbi:sugar ABC transporter ATP-binding protein, partial [Rhizobium ruizarguesonis]